MDAKYVRLEAAIKSINDYNRAFKSSLREEINKEKQRSIRQTTRSNFYLGYEAALDELLKKLDTITPKQ